MASEIESRGLIFELQWKKKPGLANKEEDIASLGIWDTADPSLDWTTFKSYLSQNLGTPEDISVAYVDSEGDELPIESECEFQEALKFARDRSRRGRKIILKVDKQDCPLQPAVGRVEKKRSMKYKRTEGMKLTDRFKTYAFDSIHPKLVALPDKRSPSEENLKSIKKVLTRDLEDLQKYNKILMEKLERMSKLEDERRKLEEERRKKSKAEKDDLPPPWFKKYMQKMKNEIVTEVTANTRQMIKSMVPNPSRSAEKSGGGYVATKVKKRNSDEESSDAALGSDLRDHKLLRNIEKLHMREKKLEKKFDLKLERLENKAKRILEKKSQSKPQPERERAPERKTRKRSSDGPVGMYLMDAILLNDGPKAETHIKLGKRFTKIWEIMNNGTLPWTDKTELRLAWGTLGLESEEPSVKCPILEPGEKGQIAVNFQAPDFPGTFESYWHFYHMGERFGHWIGCAVVVEEPNKCEKFDAESLEQKSNGALKKPNLKCTEKLDENPAHILDNNITSSNKEIPPNDIKRFNDAANSHHIHNIEVESNKKGDIAVDLSMQSKSEQISNLLCNLPNNNNINESPDQQKSNLISSIKDLHTAQSKHSRGPEYDSDSDDDNLSIISGAGVTSDSEDENFVIVPMPACFMRDTPLGSESVPIIVKDNSGKRVMTFDNSSTVVTGSEGSVASKPSHEDQKVPAFSVHDKPILESVPTPVSAKDVSGSKTYPFGSFEVTVENMKGNPCNSNHTTELPINSADIPAPFFCFSANSINKASSIIEEQPVSNESQTGTKSENTESLDDAEANFSSTTSFETTENWWDSEDLKSEIYAVDSGGSCVPLATAWPANESTKIPLGFEAKPSSSKHDKQDKKQKQVNGASKHHFRTNITSSPSVSHTYSTCGTGTSTTFSRTYSFSKSQSTSSDSNHTSSHGGVFNFTTAPSANCMTQTSSSTSSSSNSNTDLPNNPKNFSETAVHILPETIVNGAINVASSAYSTARAVLSNLRAKPLEEVIDGRWSADGHPPLRSTTENLKLLSEMGFVSTTLNVLLLQRFNNDIGKVVAELLNRHNV